MLFQKEKRIKRLNLLIMGSLFLLIIGFGIIGYKYFTYQIKNQEDINFLDEFFEEESMLSEIESKKESFNNKKSSKKESYLGVIEISKINLKQGFYSKNSSKNTVSKNVELIKESTMPDVEKGNLILAGHCGNSRVAFFKNLPKLENGDYATIYYNGKQYIYELINRYEIPKTGKANIHRDVSKTTLTLITCKHLTKKQIIFIFELKTII